MAIYQIKSSLVDSTSVLQLGKRHCRFFHKRDRRLYGAAPPPLFNDTATTFIYTNSDFTDASVVLMLMGGC